MFSYAHTNYAIGHFGLIIAPVKNCRCILNCARVSEESISSLATIALQDIFEYTSIFYNRERLHFANNYLFPVDYEMQLKFA